VQQRLELRRERERPLGVVERLDPQSIANEDEVSALTVEQREREHAVQLAQRRLAALLPEREHDLRVRVVGGEHATRGLEPSAELGRVEDLAVEDDRRAPARRRHRLVAVLEVDDREPPGDERDLAVRHGAAAVRAAVPERGAEPLEQRVVPRPHDARDPAHQPTYAATSS
jgi:hypothetical protein